MIRISREVITLFLKSDTSQKGASLAYYAVFSLLPIIIIITSILGLVFGEKAVSGEIYLQLKDALGSDASLQIQDFIKTQHINHNSKITALIGFVVLVYSASGMFVEVHNSFNSIWNIKAKPKTSFLRKLWKYLVSFLLLLSLFLIIITSTSISSFLLKYSENLDSNYATSFIFEHVLSFVVLSLIFSMMFKYLGDAKAHWKPILISGIITSILFLIGKVLIASYIGYSHVSSTFGSASVLALLMIWVFYISQIIFLGATLVKVISSEFGYEVLPNVNAINVEKK